jgi:hypothetical protein
MPYVMFFACAACHQPSSACPACVTTMLIDPLTGLPPDAAVVDGQVVHREPAEGATERSSPQPVCDNCIAGAMRAGKPGLMTAAERHRFHTDRGSSYAGG